jgi:hypothetical protein
VLGVRSSLHDAGSAGPRIGERLAEQRAIARERAAARPIVDQPERLEAAGGDFIDDRFRRNAREPRLQKKGGGKSITASTPPGRSERNKLALMLAGSVKW